MTENTTIALITGGNRGLGRAAALHLASAGADVVLTYRSNADEAAKVVTDVQNAGRRAVALRLDTTHPADFPVFAEEVARVLRESWGRDSFDVLVNNAGAVAPTPVGATGRAALDEMVAVHFTGVVLLTQELLPLLVDGGRVVNTSTGLARFTGDPSYSVYAAMKGAVEVWTRYLAKAVGGRNITANVIAPGPVATDFGGGYLRDNEDMRRALGGNSALGRVGEPDDIGAAVAALAVGGLGWVTGQRIEASGGTFL